MRAFLLSTVFALSATAALAGGVTVTEIKVPDLPLGEAVYPGGKTITLNRGIGSAAFRDRKTRPAWSGRSPTADPTLTAKASRN